MNENEKKALTTEEKLAEKFYERFSKIHPSESRYLVDLIVDLIAERSEEKAEERVDQHEREWDHGIGY